MIISCIDSTEFSRYLFELDEFIFSVTYEQYNRYDPIRILCDQLKTYMQRTFPHRYECTCSEVTIALFFRLERLILDLSRHRCRDISEGSVLA